MRSFVSSGQNKNCSGYVEEEGGMGKRINEFRSHVKGSRDKRVGNRLDEFHSCACGCRRSRSGVKRFVPLGWWLGGGMLGGSKSSVHVIYLHPC